MLSPPPVPAVAVRCLSEWHAVSICIGMVIGAGIFITTPLAAANLPSGGILLAAWAFGGAMSLAGALCFAEMAAAFPDAGGDYNFLRRAYGDGAGLPQRSSCSRPSTSLGSSSGSARNALGVGLLAALRVAATLGRSGRPGADFR